MNKVNANVNLLKENVTRINVGKTINVNECKNVMYVKKIVWNPATCSCKNGKCLADIING